MSRPANLSQRKGRGTAAEFFYTTRQRELFDTDMGKHSAQGHVREGSIGTFWKETYYAIPARDHRRNVRTVRLGHGVSFRFWERTEGSSPMLDRPGLVSRKTKPLAPAAAASQRQEKPEAISSQIARAL